MRILYIIICLCLTITAQPFRSGIKAGSGLQTQNLAPSPMMGINTFPYYNFSIGLSETIVKDIADGMVSHGLLAAGYNYLGTDGGDGPLSATRDINGDLRAIPSSFPSGVAALVSYVHGKGLKFGGYAGIEAGCEHYVCTRDVLKYVYWGYDLVKYDLSGPHTDPDSSIVMRFATALRAAGSGIVLTEGVGSMTSAYFMSAVGAQSARIGPDSSLPVAIYYNPDSPSWWDSIVNIAFAAKDTTLGGPNHWYDLDCMITGLPSLAYTGKTVSAATDDEGRSSMAINALQAAPLLIAADMRASVSPSSTTLATLTNSDVIAVDQDTLGIIGKQVSSLVCGSKTCQVWAKPLSGGSCAIGLFNLDSVAHDITATFATVAGVFPACGSGPYTTTRDLGTHTSLGTLITSYVATAVPPHGVVMIRVAP